MGCGVGLVGCAGEGGASASASASTSGLGLTEAASDSDSDASTGDASTSTTTGGATTSGGSESDSGESSGTTGAPLACWEGPGPWDLGGVIPPPTAVEGDPVAGEWALLNEDYVSCGVPYDLP